MRAAQGSFAQAIVMSAVVQDQACNCSAALADVIVRMPEDWAQERSLQVMCASEIYRHCNNVPQGNGMLHNCLQ